MMRSFLIVYAIVVVLLGVAAFSGKNTNDIALKTTRYVPGGHPVSEGDLTFVPDKTLYFPWSVGNGKTLRYSDLSDRPLYRRREGYVPVPIEIGRNTFASLPRSGENLLWLCPAKLEAFFVAEFCTRDAPECLVIVDVKKEEAPAAKTDPPQTLTPSPCE